MPLQIKSAESIKNPKTLFSGFFDRILTDGNTNAEQGYYFDPEAAKMAQELYDNPGMRILFDAAKNVSAEDLKAAAELIARIKKKEEHDEE